MFKRIFGFLALAFSLFATECWAQEPVPCTSNGGITCTFSPTQTTNTYQFGDGSRLTVQFDTVLTTFTLDVTVSHPMNPVPFDPKEFPAGTLCVQYPSNLPNFCDQYDFTGSAGGPNGVPVKNKDYKGLITLTLSYFTSQMVHNPAFGHSPGDNATTFYSEDILTGYSTPVPSLSPSPLTSLSPSPSDPTMDGTLPGLSSVIAFDEPPTESDAFCFVSPTEGQPFTVGQEIEVIFRLTNGLTCNTGTPIRDKTARLSFSTMDTSGNVVFPRLRNKEEGNKFHWNNKDGVNEFDLSTEGLAPGSYTITVFSSKFSPRSVDVTLTP